MKIKLLCLYIGLAILSPLFAQNPLQHVDPPHWWVDMADKNLQILLHGEKISEYQARIEYEGVQLIKTSKADNPNYLFLDLIISEKAKAGDILIHFSDGPGQDFEYSYTLNERENGSAMREGFDQSDVIYLAMPDRFANGDLTNDVIEGMPDKHDQSDPDARHGGDIQGIINQIPYLMDLGISAIWLNPVLENNMPEYSYHGYAITDFYKVDARFGDNDLYRELSNKLQKAGIKLIKDMVFNHCGSKHWWMNDLPFEDWIHQYDTFTRSNYRAETVMDPYASFYDKDIMLRGWFDKTMPDLNQQNPYLAKYLIQNSIWWIEEARLDGIRLDTYPYADATFMAEWMHRIKTEYPNFNVLGETWLQKEAHTAWFQDEAFPHQNDHTYLDYLTDFPGCYAINDAFRSQDSWTDGLARLYYVLSQDFLYKKPDHLILFADNHDIDRFFSTQKKQIDRWKMGMTFLLTTRGVPLIYYGTEYLDTGLKKDGDAMLRKDVPGGWPGDSVNVFTRENLSPQQNEAFLFLQKLIKIRNQHPALQKGKLVHFFPEDGIYLYFRYNDKETLMVAMNNNDQAKTINTSRFDEFLGRFESGQNLINGEEIQISDKLSLTPKSAQIFKLHTK